MLLLKNHVPSRRPSDEAIAEVPRADRGVWPHPFKPGGTVLPNPSAGFDNLIHSCIFFNELGPEPWKTSKLKSLNAANSS